jgi:putative transposase
MVKPYSMDLCERVAQAGVSEGSAREAARQFFVGASTAIRWVKRWRETGDVSPGQMGGHREKLLTDHKEWLMERLASEPDVTLRRLLAELEERGVAVSYGALWNFVHDEGLSFKKNQSRQRTAKT